MNAKVGDERYQNIVGMHGLGRRNERGERLMQFCCENKLENYTHGKVKKSNRLHHV